MAAGSISGLMVRDGAPDSASALPGARLLTTREAPETNPYCLRGMQNWIASSLALFAVTRLTSARIKRPRQLMPRIAVGGFLHETNTFAPTKATYDDFVHGGGWPAMAQGADVLRVMRNINIGLAGFVEAAEAQGWEMVPTISCGASPCAHVTRDA